VRGRPAHIIFMPFTFSPAEDIKNRIEKILFLFSETKAIDPGRITCFRSYGSKSRAVARIWALPSIWQSALSVPPQYLIEVVSEKYDKLDETEKTKVLIHELLHIPNKFSGGLVPHRCFGKRIDRRRVDEIYRKFLKEEIL